MDVRVLKILIQAHNDTSKAFNDVARQMTEIQSHFAFFNRHSLTIPRIFSQAFHGMGQALAFGMSKLGQINSMIGVHLARIGLQSNTVSQIAWKLVKLGHGLTQFGGIIEGIGKVMGPVLSGVGALGNIFLQAFGDILSTVGQVAYTIGTQLIDALKRAMVMAAVAGAAITASLAFVGKLGLDFNNFKEQTLIAFEVMFQSADKAQQKFAFLKRFADITPFDTVEVINAGKLLAAYGLQVEKFISTAGNMASAFNKPLEQAVNLLGKAKAGVFDIREFAPLGITRERLGTVGFKFKPSGEPVDRAALLNSIERIVQRDFGGMMARQSRTSAGLLSTLGAFATEELPGKLTEGLEKSRKAILLFLVDLMDMFRSSGQFDRLSASIGKVFDIIGALAYRAVQLLPAAIKTIDAFVQSGKWDSFLQTVYGVLTTVWDTLAKGLKWLSQNWPTIWNTIRETTVATVRVVGGVIAGLANIFVELVQGNINAQQSFQNLDTGIRDFAVNAISSIAGVIQILFALQAVAGVIQMTLGFMFRDVTMLTHGIMDVMVGVAGLVGSKLLKDWVISNVRSFNIRNLMPNMGDLAQNKDFTGSFARGFLGFNKGVDKALQAGLPTAALPTQPDVSDPFKVPGGADPGMEAGLAAGKALEALKEHIKFLDAQAEAWEAIVKAAESYGKMLGNSQAAINLQANALNGLLGAQLRLYDAQVKFVNVQAGSTDEWWKALEAATKTAMEIEKTRNAMRDILFDTARLKAESDTMGKIFNLSKEVGEDPVQMRNLAMEQQNVLTEMLLIERQRLSTLQAGSEEWHKQRGSIVDIIGKIVNLRKELDGANGAVKQKMLMSPSAPFGMRGAAFGPENVRGGGSELALMTRQLLQLGLNPNANNLDAIARATGGTIPGVGSGGSPGLNRGGAAGGPGMPGLPAGATPLIQETANVHADATASALKPLFDQLCACICACQKSCNCGAAGAGTGGMGAPPSTGVPTMVRPPSITNGVASPGIYAPPGYVSPNGSTNPFLVQTPGKKFMEPIPLQMPSPGFSTDPGVGGLGNPRVNLPIPPKVNFVPRAPGWGANQFTPPGQLPGHGGLGGPASTAPGYHYPGQFVGPPNLPPNTPFVPGFVGAPGSPTPFNVGGAGFMAPYLGPRDYTPGQFVGPPYTPAPVPPAGKKGGFRGPPYDPGVVPPAHAFGGATGQTSVISRTTVPGAPAPGYEATRYPNGVDIPGSYQGTQTYEQQMAALASAASQGITINVNTVDEKRIRELAHQIVDQRLDQALGKIRAAKQDRGGR